MDEIGLTMTKDMPIFLTSDRGSNIVSAVNLSEGKIIHIPCLSHCLHRAVLDGMKRCRALDGLKKCVKLATHFKQSVPATSSFQSWQRDNYPSALNYISASQTRWHGYYDNMHRVLLM